MGWKRFDIDSGTIASSYIHDTSKKISEVFHAAIKAAPSILVIDEMEAFLTDRGMAGPSGNHHVEEVAEFLRRIPEAISKGVLVFAMTNMIESIDPAILPSDTDGFFLPAFFVRSFFSVFSTSLCNSIISEGSTVNTHSILKATPFANTMPMSAPILKLINTSTKSPTIVVAALPVIAPKAARRAFAIASLRRGRFDHIIEVKMATAKEIEGLLLSKFKELPIDENVNSEYISQALDGHPMSDITFVLREAGRFAVKINVDKIDTECFENALNLLPKKKEKAKIGFVND